MLRPGLLALLLVLTAAAPAAAADLDLDLVRAAIAEQARRALPDTVVEVEVHSLYLRGRVELPAGAQPAVRVRAAGDEDWIGKIGVQVDVTDAGRPIKTLRATAEIAAYIEVAVLRNPVARGQRIQPSDLSITRRDVAGFPGGIITAVAALVGRVPRRDLPLGSLVREGDLEAYADAQRNQPVMLLISSGGLRVTAPGILRADARIGDLVEAVATGTQETVYGILISEGVVQLPTVNATVRDSSER
jgi:flagella basal body P-ring formation protein FlgA